MLSGDLVGPVAEDALGAGVPGRHHPAGVQHEDRVIADALHQEPVAVERFAQLRHQTRILESDHRLGGKGLDQLDLLVGEGPDLAAKQGEGADDLAFRHHGNPNHAAHAAALDREPGRRLCSTAARSVARS